jgi:uncharacterized protein
MMAVFSMLFGAGLILMYNRADATQGKFAGIWYRRIFWIILLGLLHGYLFWYGDILFMYGFCGLLLYPFRRRKARTIIIVGVIFLLIGPLVSFGSGFLLAMFRDQAMAVDKSIAAGEEVTAGQLALRDQWHELEEEFIASPEYIAEEILAYQGSLGEVMDYRFDQTLMMQTQGFFFREFWRIMGLMLLGMAFMKMKVFSGERSPKFYISSIAFGYGIGLPLCAHGINESLAHNFDFVHFFKIGGLYNYIGSILVSIGNVGIIVLLYKAGLLTWLMRRLAAVGRMALSNYLAHTIICTTIFYGYGFGLFGQVERFGLLMIVFAIWIIQLYISPIWLRYFHYGPAEWLWRTLTYMKWQPMKVESR